MTWELARPCSQPSEDPVQMLRRLPDGPLFLLDDHRWEGQPQRWISLGAHTDQNIVIDEDTVSALHCLLCRDRKTGRLFVLDADSKNGVWINGVALRDGKVELQSGDLLQLGAVLLLACGRQGLDEQPLLMGTSLHAILEHAERIHGSQRKAASALKVKQPTYSSWLATRKFHGD